MIRIVLLVGLIFLLGAFVHWFVHAKPAAVKSFLKRFLWVFSISALLYLTATGRLDWLVPLLGGLAAMLFRSLPFLFRLAPAFHRFWVQHRARRPVTGTEDVSTVETEFVRMKLDHDLGEISGEVLKGRFTGRTFNELDLGSLLMLREEVMGVDNDAVALIESYLDRIYPDAWRTAGSGEGRQKRESGEDKMTREEALEILGLPSNSLPDEIIKAHRRLIQKLHPDRGGSDYLAQKINRAREVLLG